MLTVARARALDGNREAAVAGGGSVRVCRFRPPVVIKIRNKRAAGLVLAEHVKPYDVLVVGRRSPEVREEDLVRKRRVAEIFARCTRPLAALGDGADSGLEFVSADWGVGDAPVSLSVAERVDVPRPLKSERKSAIFSLLELRLLTIARAWSADEDGVEAHWSSSCLQRLRSESST